MTLALCVCGVFCGVFWRAWVNCLLRPLLLPAEASSATSPAPASSGFFSRGFFVRTFPAVYIAKNKPISWARAWAFVRGKHGSSHEVLVFSNSVASAMSLNKGPISDCHACPACGRVRKNATWIASAIRRQRGWERCAPNERVRRQFQVVTRARRSFGLRRVFLYVACSLERECRRGEAPRARVAREAGGREGTTRRACCAPCCPWVSLCDGHIPRCTKDKKKYTDRGVRTHASYRLAPPSDPRAGTASSSDLSSRCQKNPFSRVDRGAPRGERTPTRCSCPAKARPSARTPAPRDVHAGDPEGAAPTYQRARRPGQKAPRSVSSRDDASVAPPCNSSATYQRAQCDYEPNASSSAQQTQPRCSSNQPRSS